MSVQDVADGGVEGLRRAEALVATPADPAAESFAGAADDAAEASAATRARTDELGGALAAAHREALDTIGRRLEAIGDTDSHLIEHLSRAAGAHGNGAVDATELRLAAEELPARLS